MKPDMDKIISDLDALARAAKSIREQRTNPDQIYDLLKWVVEAYADNCMHSAEIGMLRNKGVEAICEQLNKLQEEKTFYDGYEVIYRKKEEKKE